MTIREIINYVLFEEEELNINALGERMDKADSVLTATIASFQKTMNSQDITKNVVPSFPDNLSTLVGDTWELKELVKQIKPSSPAYPIAQKLINRWNNSLYPSLNKLDAKILEWNRKHPENKLPRVEELCKFPIRKSVSTEKQHDRKRNRKASF